MIQLGVPPVRVDIMTSLTAVAWEKAQADKVQGKYGETPTYFISKPDLITNKRSLGRKKDLIHIISDARRLFAVFIGRIWTVVRIYLRKTFIDAFDLPILRG